MRTLSGGEQKRVVLEALLRGPDEVLMLDEPDNYLDVPGKLWLEDALRESPKTVLFVSHDRELLARSATRVVTVELGAGGNTTWTHGGGFASYHEARKERFTRLEELRRRWDEEHAKIKALVLMYKQKAAYNDGMASRYQAAVTRLRMFEEAGPPEAIPQTQDVTMRLRGARTGKRAVVCEGLELTGLMKPFDLEVWYGDRVAVLGSNGSGKSHFLRLLALGGSDPDVEHRPVDDTAIAPVAHTGRARLGARVRPGWFAQTHEHPELVGRTLLDILWRGDEHRDGMGREPASRALDRYELAHAAEQTFESLSGGQQARLQILLLELSGATLLLLDEPTDNLDLVSAEALEEGLAAFDGTVVGGDPRPVVRPRLRPVPGLRRRRRGLRVRRAGLGRGPGAARPVKPLQGACRGVSPILRTRYGANRSSPSVPPSGAPMRRSARLALLAALALVASSVLPLAASPASADRAPTGTTGRHRRALACAARSPTRTSTS